MRATVDERLDGAQPPAARGVLIMATPVEPADPEYLRTAALADGDQLDSLPMQVPERLGAPRDLGNTAEGRHPALPTRAMSLPVGLTRQTLKMIAAVGQFVQQRLAKSFRLLSKLQTDADRAPATGTVAPQAAGRPAAPDRYQSQLPKEFNRVAAGQLRYGGNDVRPQPKGGCDRFNGQIVSRR